MSQTEAAAAATKGLIMVLSSIGAATENPSEALSTRIMLTVNVPPIRCTMVWGPIDGKDDEPNELVFQDTPSAAIVHLLYKDQTLAKKICWPQRSKVVCQNS